MSSRLWTQFTFYLEKSFILELFFAQNDNVWIMSNDRKKAPAIIKMGFHLALCKRLVFSDLRTYVVQGYISIVTVFPCNREDSHIFSCHCQLKIQPNKLDWPILFQIDQCWCFSNSSVVIFFLNLSILL